VKIEWMNVDDLILDPVNARTHSKRNIEAILGSLKVNGIQSPIVIDDDNVVLKGNGTVLAARGGGIEKLPCVRSDLSGAEARLYAIADNRTSELAEWNRDILSKTLQSLRDDESVEHLISGFDDDEISRLVGSWAEDDGILVSGKYDESEHETYMVRVKGVSHEDRDDVFDKVEAAIAGVSGWYKVEII